MTKLTKDEIELLVNVLYTSRWTGKQWQEVINPLIAKMGNILKELLPKEEPPKIDKKKKK